jgi:hypothetical protein
MERLDDAREEDMKRLALSALLGIAAALPALGDDVPFAEPPPSKPGDSNPYLTSLGDIMTSVQLRDIKLWQAIKAKNWDLLNFELKQVEDGMANAAMLYRNIPVEYIVSVEKPLVALREAIKTKDQAMARRSFGDLTAACNVCHNAAGVGFIVVQTPTTSPFSNQKFAPTQK